MAIALTLKESTDLSAVLKILASILPPPQDSQDAPRIVLGCSQSRFQNIVFCTESEISLRTVDSLFGLSSSPQKDSGLQEPGLLVELGGWPRCQWADCTRFLSTGDSPVFSLDYPVRQNRVTQKWLLDVLTHFRSTGISWVDAKDTWEAWELGPARTIAGKISEIFPQGEGFIIEPIGGIIEEPAYKVVVYVPLGHEDKVRDAMARCGAGHIGNYSHCTFQAPGEGTFLPLEGTHPYLGSVGKLERAREFRLETVVRKRHLGAVIEAMLKVHPYEEVAYDVYRLENAGLRLGRVLGVRFPEEVNLSQIREVVRVFDCDKGASSPAGHALLGSCPKHHLEESSTKSVCVSRFLDLESVQATAEFGSNVLIYVEDTYEGRVWAKRLGLSTIGLSKGVYTKVLTNLRDALTKAFSAS